MNDAVVALPSGLTLPLSVAAAPVTAVAAWVMAVGALAAAVTLRADEVAGVSPPPVIWSV
jgi:hypothetical protein